MNKIEEFISDEKLKQDFCIIVNDVTPKNQKKY